MIPEIRGYVYLGYTLGYTKPDRFYAGAVIPENANLSSYGLEDASPYVELYSAVPTEATHFMFAEWHDGERLLLARLYYRALSPTELLVQDIQ